MKNYAVFGNPIKHSLSPLIHTNFASQFDIKLDYQRILATDFATSAKDFIASGGGGFNITVPFKEDAYNLCNQLSATATLAGAVNTINVKGGVIYGDNTDGVGLVNDLTKNIGLDLADKVILILGAGGATRGIIQPLLNHNPKKLMIANRTPQKAQDLAAKFSNLGKTCGFGLDKVKDKSVDIVINATSSGLTGDAPQIAKGCVNGAICYDLMYGTQTKFMDFAIENNAKSVYDGWGMLVEQAAKAFEIWFQKTPDTKFLINNKL